MSSYLPLKAGQIWSMLDLIKKFGHFQGKKEILELSKGLENVLFCFKSSVA